MRNNETGEFELIIGNRQLLSGFFIVVLLFAVAFAMGYVVGQNSPKSAKVAADSASPSSTPAGDAQRPAPVAAVANPPQANPAPAGETVPPPAADAPAQPAPQPTESAPAPAAPSAAESNGSAAGPAKTYPEPPPAPAKSYWQVIAVAQSDVDVFYRTLKERGFPTYVEPGTKGLMRVLVGPYTDREAMGKAKDEIMQLGFKNPVRR